MFGRFANYFVLFFVTVFLTRILNPEEFGTFGIVFSVVALSSVLLDFGFRIAIVQSQEVTQTQLSTVFFVNLGLATGLALMLVTVAPFLQAFYEIEGLAWYLTATASVFILNGLLIVPTALLQRNLKFKQISTINLVVAVTSGATAIFLALNDFRIWSLIIQQILSTFLLMVCYFAAARWRPSLSFSLSSIKQLWDYGSKMFFSGLLEVVFARIDVFVIGKLFSISLLGFYTRAQSLDHLIRNFSVSTILSVMFPLFAKFQADTEKLLSYYDRCLNVISFISFLLIGTLFLTARDIVIILFTEKWEPVSGYFRVMALFSFVYPASAIMVNLISARGNSKAILQLEIIKKLFLVPAYFLFFIGGIYMFLAGLGTAYVISLFLNMLFIRREIRVSVSKQSIIIGKYLLISVIGTLTAYFLTNYFAERLYVHLLVSASLFQVIYLFLNYLFGFSGFTELVEQLRSLFNDKRNSDILAAS